MPTPAVNTRPNLDAKPLSVRLYQAGFQVFDAPMMEIIFETIDDQHTLQIKQAAIDGVLGSIFTSANGVRAWTQDSRLQALNDRCTCCCVGPITAEAAREAGFVHIKTANGDVQAIQEKFSKMPEWKSLSWWHIRGFDQRGNFVETLRNQGFVCSALPAYRAEEITILPRALIEEVQTRRPMSVLLYSPRTARFFEQALTRHDLSAKNLRAYCLSRAVGDTLRLDWEAVHVAQKPISNALEQLLIHREM